MRGLRLMFPVVVLFVAMAALSLPGAHHARADGPVQVTVQVADDGFHPDTIEVDQGALVELTFVWANQAHPDDTHVIVAPQLKLQSDMITSANKTTTLKFVATNSGTFNFKCDVECDVHAALQHGTIKVKAAGSGATGTSALQPTKVSIDQTGVFVRGSTVTLAAFLYDAKGQPIPKAEVTFYAEEEFVGQKSLVDIGKAKTGPSGLAQLVYHPHSPEAEKLVVKFDGMGVYDASEQSVEVPANRLFGPPKWEPEIALHGIRAWAPVGLVALIGGIWVTFGYILYQAWSVSRDGAEGGGSGA